MYTEYNCKYTSTIEIMLLDSIDRDLSILSYENLFSFIYRSTHNYKFIENH